MPSAQTPGTSSFAVGGGGGRLAGRTPWMAAPSPTPRSDWRSRPAGSAGCEQGEAYPAGTGRVRWGARAVRYGGTQLPGQRGACERVGRPRAPLPVPVVCVREDPQTSAGRSHGGRRGTRKDRCAAAPDEEVDRPTGAIAKVGGAEADGRRDAGEGGYHGVGLLYDHAVGISAKTAKKERYAPEGAPISTLLVGVRLVAEGLVRAGWPCEYPLPPAHVEQRREVTDVVDARH
eukprot:1820916-Pleurochrysis_carterae.AAC.1